ncbi:MAG: phosphoenolpyruvate carboxykinase (ATP), partial [Acidobacteriia bacterium]|nr:phosphoenolpyruvate carboxykinase (ATP) [Terriglobia bacterium]
MRRRVRPDPATSRRNLESHACGAQRDLGAVKPQRVESLLCHKASFRQRSIDSISSRHAIARRAARQDDVVFLRRDGSSYGTELGFYVKTDVDVKLQEAMYNALIHHTALLENVMVDAKGKIDFLDERLGENGRGVLDRRE